MGEKILVTIPCTAEQMKRFGRIGDYEITFADENKIKESQVVAADIIMGYVEPELIKKNTHLKWYHSSWAGVGSFLKEGIIGEDTIITNSTGAYGLAISEHILACTLMLQKKLNLYMDNQKAHKWKDEGEVTGIWNSTALIVGLGDIGTQTAYKLHALGCRVRAIRNHQVSETPDYVESVHTLDELDKLLAEADIVAVTLPGTDKTAGLFDAARFKKMKKSAIFINVGRGSVVDTDALNTALREGWIRGAAIDVAQVEPIPKDAEIWDAPDIIITPHISGRYNHLPETLKRVVDIAIEELKLYSKGEELKNIVDRDTGYRRFEGQELKKPRRMRRFHPLILASASPRRAELLSKVDIPFEVRVSKAPENSQSSDPVLKAEENSYTKAMTIAEKLKCAEDEEYIVLGADTVVCLDDKIFGKPESESDAFEMIKELQGGTHRVITGVTLVRRHGDETMFNTFHENTMVSIYPMTDEQIREYISTGEPMDKAGSYGIQGIFAKYIRNIKGDYNNVVGLPIGHVFRELKKIRKQ
ncbi:MAG: septum formation protein Maf [Lachnospiraceae bacterium]|nr:septum formation protein Maf [Lachnospiraceae bacterium]